MQFDAPETVEALEWMQGFWEPVGGAAAMHRLQPGLPRPRRPQSPFTTGNQTFTVTNPSQIFHIKANNPGLDFGVALPPSRAQGFRGQELHPRGWSYGIPGGVKHPYESWLLVRWLSATKEAAGWFMQQQLRPSPMKEVNEDRSYVEKLPTVWPQLLKAMEKDVAVPITPVDGEIDRILNQLITDVDQRKGAVRDLITQAATDTPARAGHLLGPPGQVGTPRGPPGYSASCRALASPQAPASRKRVTAKSHSATRITTSSSARSHGAGWSRPAPRAARRAPR